MLHRMNTEPVPHKEPQLIHSVGSVPNTIEADCISSKHGGRWTDAEHRRFLDGLKKFGRDWRAIEEHIGTRSCSQIRSHAQKYFLRFEKLKEEHLKNL